MDLDPNDERRGRIIELSLRSDELVGFWTRSDGDVTVQVMDRRLFASKLKL